MTHFFWKECAFLAFPGFWWVLPCKEMRCVQKSLFYKRLHRVFLACRPNDGGLHGYPDYYQIPYLFPNSSSWQGVSGILHFQAAVGCCTLLQAAAGCCRLLHAAARCCRLLQAAARCWTLLQAAGRCWTLLYAAAGCCTLLQAAVGGCWLLYADDPT